LYDSTYREIVYRFRTALRDSIAKETRDFFLRKGYSDVPKDHVELVYETVLFNESRTGFLLFDVYPFDDFKLAALRVNKALLSDSVTGIVGKCGSEFIVSLDTSKHDVLKALMDIESRILYYIGPSQNVKLDGCIVPDKLFNYYSQYLYTVDGRITDSMRIVLKPKE
jgi:hypothetical protein